MVEGAPDNPVPPGRDPDAYDRRRRRILWSLPNGLYVLGSAAGGQRNLMTHSWAMQVATEPKLVAVGVEVGALTHRLITDGGSFALSILDRKDRAVVRKFVKPLDDGHDPGHLAGFDVHQAVSGAPILTLAAAWLDCRLTQSLDCGSHSLFVGEVVDCGAGMLEESDILRMEDTRMSYGG